MSLFAVMHAPLCPHGRSVYCECVDCLRIQLDEAQADRAKLRVTVRRLRATLRDREAKPKLNNGA